MAHWLLLLQILHTQSKPSATPMAATSQMGATNVAEIQPATLLDLSGVWLQHPSDNRTFAQQNLDDRQWSPILLPKTGGQQQQFPAKVQWYRRHFFLQTTQLLRSMRLYLGSLRDIGEIYINDQLLYARGSFTSGQAPHEAWLLPIQQTIPAGWLQAGDNVISIRVLDIGGGSGVPIGPMLLGEMTDLELPSKPELYRWLELRVMLVWLSWLTALASLLLYRSEGWATFQGCLAAGILLADGTGLLWHFVPNTKFAAILPHLSSPLLLYSLLRYLQPTSLLQRSLALWLMERCALALMAVLLLAPQVALLPYQSTIQFALTLSSLLWLAKGLANSLSSRTNDTLLFVGNLLLIGLLLYQFLFVPGDSMWPNPFALGALALFVLHTLFKLDQTIRQHHSQSQTIQANLLQQQQLSEQDALLNGYRAFAEPVLFLQSVVQDVARTIDVRKCSILLPDKSGQLVIAAARGLTMQAQYLAIPAGPSIANHVFATGEPLSPSTLPTNLHPSQRINHPFHYETSGFLAYPISNQGKILGVINVSDRNNGGSFHATHELQLRGIAQQLAICLQATPVRWSPPSLESAVISQPAASPPPTPHAASPSLGPVATQELSGRAAVPPNPVDTLT